jgi:3-deoxy-D-manno-octulosonate 8-phosphate phosphatase (KDO 8-P phosphatase)
MACDPLDLARKAAGIRLLLFDVDGVLTDGRILLHGDGSESKQFGIRDGTGIVWAQRAGIATGLLSARQSPATAARASQLGIRIVRQQAGDKLQMYRELLEEERLDDGAVAFMGDDLLDLPVLSRVGLSAAPADAAPDVVARVHFVSSRAGGDGAARELVELVLRAQGKWESLLESYLPEVPR